MPKPNYILDHITANDANVAVGHTFSLGALIGILTHLLPAVAAVAPLVFYCLMVWESKTVQAWRRKRRLLKSIKRKLHARHIRSRHASR